MYTAASVFGQHSGDREAPFARKHTTDFKSETKKPVFLFISMQLAIWKRERGYREAANPAGNTGKKAFASCS